MKLITTAKKVIPIETVLEFFLELALFTPDKIQLAWSRPSTRKVRESFRFFKIRYDRERGTFDNIKCFRSAAFDESLPMTEIQFNRLFHLCLEKTKP